MANYSQAGVLRIQAIPSPSPIPRSLRIIDSHTAGEPTRVVLARESGFDLGSGPLIDRLEHLRSQHDILRRAILCEPRGSDVLVGAWLLDPDEPGCDAAVIFFNNAGYLGMCGHGTLGLAATLSYLQRTKPGNLRIQTPAGVVQIETHDANRATIHNVPAARFRKDVAIDVPGYGSVTGDVAYGGNWFFLIADHGKTLEKSCVDELTDYTWAIRRSLASTGITGAEQQEIDHIELFGPPRCSANHSRNFVLCPGKAYDRSPCGTGTSAKLACLAADGKLEPRTTWRQEGILGTVFESSYEWAGDPAEGIVRPSITGDAFVTAETTLHFDPGDPFSAGILE